MRSAAAGVWMVLVTGVAVVMAQYKPYDDDHCLLCMCKTLGNGICNTKDPCPDKKCFGPFHITAPYWRDAGSPVQPGDNKLLPGAFQRCVEEPFCAVKTIRGIMSKYILKDFDGDGRVTCVDLQVAHWEGVNFAGAVDVNSGKYPLLQKCLKEAYEERSTPRPYLAPTVPSWVRSQQDYWRQRVPPGAGSTSGDWNYARYPGSRTSLGTH